MSYVKVRFTSERNGVTAGLIFEKEKLDKMSMTQVSLSFPMYEANKMEKFEVSPTYETWESAFAHNFA